MANVKLSRVLAVAAGGTIGTAARLGLGLVMPNALAAVFIANIIGALLIGILTARLPVATGLRIFLGTGILGGFTTYSSFMTGTVTLWHTAPLLATGYAIATLLLGLAAAFTGLRIGRPKK